MEALVRVVAVLVPLAMGGCFTPELGPAPFACAGSPRCPEGYRCVGGVCRRGGDDARRASDEREPADRGREAVAGDAPADLAVGPDQHHRDAPRPDSGRDAAKDAQIVHPGDDFNRADSNQALGTSSSGHAWSAPTGTWGIASGRAYLVSTGGNPRPVALLAGQAADGTVRVTLSGHSAGVNTDFGLALRWSGGKGYVLIGQELNARYVLSYFDGSNYSGTKELLRKPTDGDVVEVELAGATFGVSVNGKLELTAGALTNNVNATGHGLANSWNTGNAKARFDDYSFVP
jgi:hypothetical protein